MINARRMHTRVTVLTLCVRLCVCVSPVYKALRRAVLQFEHNCRLYAFIARFLLNAFFQKLQPFSAMLSRPLRVRIL